MVGQSIVGIASKHPGPVMVVSGSIIVATHPERDGDQTGLHHRVQAGQDTVNEQGCAGRGITPPSADGRPNPINAQPHHDHQIGFDPASADGVMRAVNRRGHGGKRRQGVDQGTTVASRRRAGHPAGYHG